MHCGKFGYNYSSGSEEEDLKNVVNVFSLFHNYLPLKIGRGPSFDQTSFPFTQGCIVASFFKIVPVVLEKNFLKFVNAFVKVFSKFVKSPFGKGQGLIFKNKLNPLYPRIVFTKFG